jgi:hypothetical protein
MSPLVAAHKRQKPPAANHAETHKEKRNMDAPKVRIFQIRKILNLPRRRSAQILISDAWDTMRARSDREGGHEALIRLREHCRLF